VTPSPRWSRWLPWGSLGAFSALWLARWPSFPLVLDPSYHLFIAEQVVSAGGPIGYEWWEYAPVGRPHLYPPVLHLLLAGLLKVSGSPVLAIRVISVTLLPLLLMTLFLVTRRLLTPSIALTSLWMGMVPFAFHLHSAVALAATLGMVELLWFFQAVEAQRPIAAGLLIALVFYSHLGLPWMTILAVGCYAGMRPALRRQLAKASWGLLLVLPWWWHLWSYRAAMHQFPRYENALIELTPLLYGIALVGAWRCWRLKGRFFWPLACWVGFLPLASGFRYRWLVGEGMLPVILLTGVGADWVAERMATARTTEGTRALAGVTLFLALCLSPTLAARDGGMRWVWPDGAPLHLVGVPWAKPKTLEAGALTPGMSRLAERVAELTQPGDILWSNAPHALGLIAALAHRPMSCAMLSEIAPAKPADPLDAAQWVVWFKLDPTPGVVAMSRLKRAPFHPVAEDDLAMIFRREGERQTARIPQAVLPLGIAWMLLAVVIGLAAWDLSRHSAAIPV